MAAMVQGDEKLQYPMINNLGNEVWKCKEAKQIVDDAPLLGDPEKRGIMMEAIGAVSYLMAGSSMLIMRHPESIRLAKDFIKILADGGSAKETAPITKKLGDVKVDFAALAPKLDLTIEEEKKKAAPAATAAKAEAPKPAPAAAAAPAPKAEAKAAAPAAPAAPAVDAAAAAKTDAEAAVKAEADAKAKAEADATAKAAAAAKAKADAEAAVKAEAEAKAKAEADAVAAARQAREAEEKALQEKRAQERKGAAAHVAVSGPVAMTAAALQLTEQEKILAMLNRFHKRAQ